MASIQVSCLGQLPFLKPHRPLSMLKENNTCSPIMSIVILLQNQSLNPRFDATYLSPVSLSIISVPKNLVIRHGFAIIQPA